MGEEDKITFSNRITDVWDYPKLSTYNNQAGDPSYFHFLSGRNQSFTRDMRLYVHIPFCKSFCSFCQFYKEPCSNEGLMKQYVEAVIRELAMYAGTRYMAEARITSIYFGGGDPSCLKLEHFQQLISAIHSLLPVDEKVSITVEGNVMFLLNPERIALYQENRVSRISFGVQTFNEGLRKKLLLKPTLDDIHRLVQLFHDMKFPDYTFDLMYNLPDQSMDDLAADLEMALALNPHFIDFFNLNIYPNTRFYDSIYKQEKFEIKPSKAAEYRMVKHIGEHMREAGYNHVCSVTYSKREEEAHLGLRQFLLGSDMLGIGASARSFLHNKPFRNVCSVEEYLKKTGEGQFPVETGLLLEEEELETRRMVLFPTLLKVKVQDIPDREDMIRKIGALIHSGYLEASAGYVRLTEEGKCWVGNIQKYLYADKWREKEFATFLASVRAGKSAYNQDFMGVSKTASAVEEG